MVRYILSLLSIIILKIDSTAQISCTGTTVSQSFNYRDYGDFLIETDGWTTYNSTGTVDWFVDTYNGNDFAKITNYSGGSNYNCETWLISPAIDLSGTGTPLLNFKHIANYQGAALELYVSTNYSSGNPASNGTWVSITNLATWDTDLSTWGNWVCSGDINLTPYKSSSTRVAFKYLGSNSDGCTHQLDNILIFDGPSFSTNNYPDYNIAEVTTENSVGEPDSNGVECHLTGVVYGINTRASTTGLSFTIIDATGGISCYNGSTTFGYNVNEGDLVEVYGNIGHFNGKTQLYLDTLFLTNSNNPLISPTFTTSLNEGTESSLIKIENVTINNPLQWTGTGSGFDVVVSDTLGNQYAVRIDNDCDLFSTSAPTGRLNITGIGSQYDPTSPYTEGYQIIPRYSEDIEEIIETSIGSVESTIQVSPNPSSNGIFNIDLSSNNGDLYLKVFDIMGKVVHQETINSSPQNFILDLSNENTGMYLLTIENKQRKRSFKLIKY